MTPATYLVPDPDGLLGRLWCQDWTGRFTNRIGQCQQVVARRTESIKIGSETQNLPPAWRAEAVTVVVAQVVGMRLGVGGQRSQDRGLV